MKRLTQLFALAFVFIPLLAVEAAVSQQRTPAPVAPLLPESGDESIAGLIINAVNAKDFKSAIVPELYPLIRANLLELDALRSLRYRPELNFGAEAQEVSPSGELSPDGSIKIPQYFSSGILFRELSKEDSAALTRKVLWNVQSGQWSNKYVESHLVVSWLQGYKLVRQFGGYWKRIYPKGLTQGDKSIQLFRETIEFFAPAAVRGFFWTTFRFFGEEEDMFWLYSPVIEKARQLTGTNRSDPLLNTSIAPDDLGVWSGKLELIEPKEIKQISALAFFAGLEAENLKNAPENCHEFSDEPSIPGKSKSAKWNYEVRRYNQAFGWVPTGAVSVPRKMWRIEMATRDPYSSYGRQVLYVDAELYLPLYKFVYNRAGYLWKIVIGVYNQFTTAAKDRNYFYPQYLIVDDLISKNSNIVEASKIYFCERLSERVRISDFDPQAKSKKDQSNEAKSPTPTPKKAQ